MLMQDSLGAVEYVTYSTNIQTEIKTEQENERYTRVKKVYMNVLPHHLYKLYCCTSCTLVVFSSQAEKSWSMQTIASISLTGRFSKALISALN